MSALRHTFLLAVLVFFLANACAGAAADTLFQPKPGVHSDRAAGIGKRVKPGATLVLAEVRGPAIIRHIWMTNVRQVEPAISSGRVTICFTWDGHSEPDLVVPLNEFFGARFTEARELVFTMALGKNAYYPMPFREAARIELRNNSDVELWGVYWQIDYDRMERLPADATPFTAATRISAPELLGSTGRTRLRHEGRGELAAGRSLAMAELSGPAVIRRLVLNCDSKPGADHVRLNRGVVVRMFWDGEEHPSVEAPLGDFFGTGFGEQRDFASAAWACSGARREIRFPMPFRRSARLELANLAGETAEPLSWSIEYERSEAQAGDVEYFHACFRMSRPVPLNSTHVAMETTGRGKFVGFVWSCHWLNAEQKPEGTQNFWIDGRRIQSTGSEDYFGRAWGFGSAPECHGYKGINLGPEPSASAAVPAEWRRVTAYRSHVIDPLHFQQSLKLDFTCYGYNRGHRTDEYATVCFWYQAAPHTKYLPLPPLEDLLPLDHPDSWGYGMHQIARAESRRDFAAALTATDALLRRYPHNPAVADLEFKRASLLEETGRVGEARRIFRELVRAHRDDEIARDAADKIWLLEEPGRLLLKAAAPSRAEIHLDGQRVAIPLEHLQGMPGWGRPEIYRFTYPPFRVAWDSPSSAVMRLPTLRLSPGPGRHVIAVNASAAQDEPIFTPRVGYFFATLDLAGPDVVTDGAWKVSLGATNGWTDLHFDDHAWAPASVHPLARYGDGAWTWLWPRGFRLFSGAMERIWSPAIYREEREFRESLLLRRTFEVPP